MFQNDVWAVTAAGDAVLLKKFQRKIAQVFTLSILKFSPLSNKLKIKAALQNEAELGQLEVLIAVSSELHRQKHDFFEININCDMFYHFRLQIES